MWRSGVEGRGANPRPGNLRDDPGTDEGRGGDLFWWCCALDVATFQDLIFDFDFDFDFDLIVICIAPHFLFSSRPETRNSGHRNGWPKLLFCPNVIVLW
jgi:hypothetical protein